VDVWTLDVWTCGRWTCGRWTCGRWTCGCVDVWTVTRCIGGGGRDVRTVRADYHAPWRVDCVEMFGCVRGIYRTSVQATFTESEEHLGQNHIGSIHLV